MKRIYYLQRIILSVLLLLPLSGCFDSDINRKMYEADDDEMQRENHIVGATLRVMQGLVSPTREHLYQFMDAMAGGAYGGYMEGIVDTWVMKFSTFNPEQGWLKSPFADPITDLYPQYLKMLSVTDDPVALALGKILRVCVMHRVTDIYGPIPYSQMLSNDNLGENLSVPYDSQEQVYTQMLKELEEAKERDHRKIGKEMELFMTDDLVGRGLPMFLPKGYTVWQELENYIKNKERKLGYLHVMTPCVCTVNLYKTSGHWDHYKENMFPPMEMEGESFVLRPMNCPHHMMIYANRRHSYKDLPILIGEFAHDFLYESSGTLKGIERGRHFCQNDAHLFVTPEQIEDEFTKVVDLIFSTYKDFGITNYRCVLSLRDPANKEKYHDDDAMWNKAEDALRTVLNDLKIDYTEEIGEAAFYGPKLDVNVQPTVDNEITLSTCQLDFCLPAKFNLSYVDRDGEKKTPVVLHRAILGSLDRFMAYILEETKGNLPTWLAPVQVRVMPVKTDNEELTAYAKEICDAVVQKKE